MILLLGGSGYVGRAFASHLHQLKREFYAPSHGEFDATCVDSLAELVARIKPEFAINAIGYTGRPNIDSTEQEKLRCLTANTVVPGVISEVLSARNIPWGHVSSGCIFQGIRADGQPFTEEDEPNFAFGHPQASWYSRTKAMAETMLKNDPQARIWRLRIPFDQYDNERNYLTKIMRYDRLLEVENSISQLQEFAAVALDTLFRRLPAGIYNVTNPGFVRTSEVAAAIKRHGLCDKSFEFFHDEAEFLSDAGRVRRASCILSSQKLADHGLVLREIHEALDWTLRHWQWAR